MKLTKKNKLLIGVFILMLYICYSFAFSNTLEYYTIYQSKKESLKNSNESPELLAMLQQKNSNLDADLSRYTYLSETSFQNELLNKISQLSAVNHLKIISFNEPHFFNKGQDVTRSYSFSLEGSFNGILLLLNAIENDGALGYIRHISFNKKINYKTNTNYLLASVLLQKNESYKVVK